MLNDMLCDIVAILINNQIRRATVQLLQKVTPRGLLTMFKHPLDYSAAVWMSCQTMHLSRESIDDELDMFGWNSFDCFLHNMITILILDTLENLMLQLFDQRSLLVYQDVFESLL